VLGLRLEAGITPFAAATDNGLAQLPAFDGGRPCFQTTIQRQGWRIGSGAGGFISL